MLTINTSDDGISLIHQLVQIIKLTNSHLRRLCVRLRLESKTSMFIFYYSTTHVSVIDCSPEEGGTYRAVITAEYCYGIRALWRAFWSCYFIWKRITSQRYYIK